VWIEPTSEVISIHFMKLGGVSVVPLILGYDTFFSRFSFPKDAPGMLELFFPFSEHTVFFVLIGLGLFLLFSRNGFKPTWYHLDLLMILAWVPLPDYEVGNLKVTMILGWLPLFYWIPRSVYLFVKDPPPDAEARLTVRALKALAALAAAYVIFLTLVSPRPFADFGEVDFHVSDSAISGYTGGDRILKGELPYPEGETDFEANQPYGPAYFFLYVPFVYAFPETNPYVAYCLGARLFTILLALAGGGLLLRLGSKLGGPRIGWAWAVFWLASPYLHNSVYWSQTSHIMPGVLTILAIAGTLRSATLGGAALGLAASVAYYPLLFLPFLAKASGRPVRFAITCAAVVGGCFLPVLLARNGLSRFLEHVFFVEGSMAGEELWGRWSPWAQHPFLMPVRTVLMLMYAVALPCLVLWSLRRPLSLRAAVAGSAFVVAGFQVWKEHAPGRYHLWLFPLLLILILWPRASAPRSAE